MALWPLVVLCLVIPLLLIPLGVIGAIIAVIVGCEVQNHREPERTRLARLLPGREGESICTFARSFDYRRMDTWILRAVYEEIQPYCHCAGESFPLRSSDRILEDLEIDPEDYEDSVVAIADRSGRSLQACERNPFYGKTNTVSGLVMFLQNQPREPLKSL